METRARFALIGLFTICVIAAAAGFIFWFSSSRGGANLKPIEVVFDTPVTGLSQGGAVLFNGIRVGEVSSLYFDGRDPRLVVARVNISPDVPLKTTTKARLEFSGLTGVASIQLFDSDPRAPDLKKQREEDVPRIRAIASPSLTTVLETMQSAGKHADEILVRVNRIVATNEQPINDTISNIAKLSAALDAEKINRAVDNIANFAAKIDVDKINHAVGSIDTVVSSLDVSSVNHTLKSIDSFATALADSSADVRAAVMDATEFASKLNHGATAVDKLIADNSGPLTDAINKLDQVFAAVEPEKVRSTVDGLSKVATTLGNNASQIDGFIKDAGTFAKALADSSADVRAAVMDATELAAKLNRSATAVDRLIADNSAPLHDAIANVDKILAAVDADKVRDTVDGFNKVATTLGNDSGEIDSVLKDGRSLVASLDRSAAQVETFLTSGAPQALTRTVLNIEAATSHIDGQKVGAAIDDVVKFANALGDNTPRVNAIAKNADELFGKLDRSADTLDQVLVSARDLLRSPEGKGALAGIGDAARSVRKLADDLDHRSADLLANLTKFSGSGLRDIQLFAIDGRRALGDVGRTLQGVQRNPQQFIFGGKGSLPVYGN